MANILVVDDRPTNRQFLTALLGYFEHVVVEAGDGAQALERARAARPDLVITDILMPTMDGYEFVRRLRADPATALVPVIFYTATYGAPEARALADACGVDIVLPKPCEPERIIAAVNQALGLETGAGVGRPDAAQPAARGTADPLGASLEGLQDVRRGIVEISRPDARPSPEKMQQLSDALSERIAGLQRIGSRLTAFIEVGMDMTAERDPGRLVALFFGAACDIVDAGYAGLGLLNEDERALRFVRAKGIDAGVLSGGGAGPAGLLGTILRTREGLRARAPLPSGGLPGTHPPVRDFLGVPVVTRERAYGWLYFADSRGSAGFTEEDERLAGMMASKLAVLYENAVLYDVIQRHAAQLQIEMTERRRSARALEESEARYRELVEQASDGIFLTDSGGRFVLVNSHYCQMLGYAEEELLGVSAATTHLEADKEDFARRLAAFPKEKRGLFERVMRRKDGTSFPAEISMHWLENGTNQGIVRDITQRKEAEQALAESDFRFRQLADNIAEVFWLTSTESNELLYLSPGYEKIWGRSCAEVYARPRTWMDAIHPEDAPSVLRAYLEKQASGSYDEEYRIIRPDGAMRWIRDRAFPVRDTDGRVYRIAGVAEDITERKRTLEQLRESERRFSDMLGTMDLISVMLDPEGRITYCNDCLLRTTGWRRDELLGKDWCVLLPAQEAETMRALFADLLAGGPAAWHHDNEIVTRHREKRLIRWNNTVLRSASGDVVGTASIGEDVTERRRAEEGVRRLNRVYAVLSGINSLIVRVRDRDELFRGACRIAAEEGGLSSAWIGLLDRAAMTIRPAAWHNASDGLFDAVQAGFAVGEGTAGSSSLLGIAVREKRPQVSNDVINDARILFKAVHLRHNYRSMTVLPLLVSGEVAGILVLHAGVPGFFDAGEMKLLEELAGDIGFALDHIEKEERLDYLAYYDALTGLANRTLLKERLDQYLGTAARNGHKAALALLDIERFKSINDALGRTGGDELLKQVAARIAGLSEDPRMVARIGADQFAIVAPSLQENQIPVGMLEQRYRKCFGPPFLVNGSEIRIAAKHGIAFFPADGVDAEALLNNAEAALKKAKATGQRTFFYNRQLTENVGERVKLESQLRHAVEREEFVLHYQPKVELAARRIVGVEALIRWRSPELGLVPPASFIPVLEETGLILEVGTWALRQAVIDHRHWLRELGHGPRIAVNVSPIQLREHDFVDKVRRAIGSEASSRAMDLEITESLVMDDVEGNIVKLVALRRLGIDISIDDFGTGYSSLGYLARLPVQALKIDRTFITRMLDEPDTMTLVATIVSMAHALRLRVIAEGVENEQQAAMLRLLRCDEMQGFLVSKPVDRDAITAMLRLDSPFEADPAA
jgi:diguanylate cyclase (GGDEF)-like protein/PAS domain S-box-containing protein